MKTSKTVRVVLDVAMSAMIVFEMFIQFTGEFLHEVVGFAFFATVAAHLALSASWTKKTVRNAKEGKLTARRTALAVIGCSLALATVVLGVSSVAISGILASAGFTWPIGTYSTWAAVHTFSAYAFCALVVVHLAMHWSFLASAFKVPYNPSRRRAIGMGVNAMAALGVAALGVTAVGKTSAQAATETVENSGSSEKATSGRSSKSRGKGSGSASAGSTSGPGSSSGSGTGSGSGSRSSNPASSSASGTSSNSAPSRESSGSGGTTSNAAGICTLCRKQCPLSAPKCDKPYAAGLL